MEELCPKHKVIFLPLSIDVDYVKQFKTKKTKDAAFAGRLAKLNQAVPQERRAIPKDIDILGGLEREELLKAMAPYRTIYAVGRTAIEAKCLGAKIGIYNNLCPEGIWDVIDNSEAAWILQRKLDKIDGITADRKKKLEDELASLKRREKEVKKALKELEKEEELCQ